MTAREECTCRVGVNTIWSDDNCPVHGSRTANKKGGDQNNERKAPDVAEPRSVCNCKPHDNGWRDWNVRCPQHGYGSRFVEGFAVPCDDPDAPGPSDPEKRPEIHIRNNEDLIQYNAMSHDELVGKTVIFHESGLSTIIHPPNTSVDEDGQLLPVHHDETHGYHTADGEPVFELAIVDGKPVCAEITPGPSDVVERLNDYMNRLRQEREHTSFLGAENTRLRERIEDVRDCFHEDSDAWKNLTEALEGNHGTD